MSSRRSRIRKREKQKRKYAALRPKTTDKPISHVKTAGLLSMPLQPATFFGVLAEVFKKQT